MSGISFATVTTRKVHVCWGCTASFPAKSKLTRVTSADLGKIFTAYWCEPCESFIDEARGFDPYIGDCGFEFGYVKERRDDIARMPTKGTP